MLISLPLFFFILFLFVGRYYINPLSFFRFDISNKEWALFYFVRLPRILLAMCVGAALSVSGVTLQGVSRNPLVGPEILGVSSGAGFGAALAILYFGNNIFAIQLCSFIFGLIAVFITYFTSSSLKRYGSSVLSLILSGIAISAVFSALIGILKYIADPYDKLPQIVFWLMGSFASVTWNDFYGVFPMIIVGILILVIFRWKLNIISMGEEEAKTLGMAYGKTRIVLIVGSTLATSAAVSISGIISWVGLIVPHLTRKLVGPNHQILVLASLSIGCVFMAVCDTFARSLFTFEVPIGIITALCGAPLFILLLRMGGNHKW